MWMETMMAVFADALDHRVALWQRDNTSLSAMLKLSEGECVKKRASLLDAIGRGVQKYKKIRTAEGVFDLSGDISIGGVKGLSHHPLVRRQISG